MMCDGEGLEYFDFTDLDNLPTIEGSLDETGPTGWDIFDYRPWTLVRYIVDEVSRFVFVIGWYGRCWVVGIPLRRSNRRLRWIENPLGNAFREDFVLPPHDTLWAVLYEQNLSGCIRIAVSRLFPVGMVRWFHPRINFNPPPTECLLFGWRTRGDDPSVP